MCTCLNLGRLYWRVLRHIDIPLVRTVPLARTGSSCPATCSRHPIVAPRLISRRVNNPIVDLEPNIRCGFSLVVIVFNIGLKR